MGTSVPPKRVAPDLGTRAVLTGQAFAACPGRANGSIARMTDEAAFTIRLEETGGATIVHCIGRLISSTTGELHARVKPLVGQRTGIVLDLCDLTFMDSMGLGAIATLYVTARRAACPFEVVHLRPRIRDLFTVTHLLSLFEPCGSSNAIIP